MFLQFVKSAFFVLSIFGSSIFTAYNLCKIKKIHFINPELIKNKSKFGEYIVTIGKTILPVFTTTTCINIYFIGRFDTNPHSFLQTILNCAAYSLIAEMSYYVYHRAIHHKYFYKQIHSKHHENVVVYPLDSLYFTSTDIIFYISCLHTPLLFLRMDWFEYFIAVYFYVTMGFLSHSSICYNHHVLHHKLFKCNYCLVFPYFDIAFQTLRMK
jgi:sterol desaturase/sphingolipid hydroxylase (fatty acid hydroxylase superfamily)